MQEYIELTGARLHNLKNISLKIPKNKIVAITGVSGSGKSSLAFDLLFEEGQLRYFQAIGMPPRLENEKPFDTLIGLSPPIAVEQRTVRFRNPRSTVGTKTNIYNSLRMLYAAEADYLCPICKVSVGKDLSCEICGMTVTRSEVKQFSFNEPSGMCLKCQGRGYVREFISSKLIPDPNWKLFDICATATGCFADLRNWMPSLAEYYKFDVETPYKNLPKKVQDVFLNGSGNKKIPMHFESKNYTHDTEKIYEGVIPHLERAMDKSVSEYRRKMIEQKYMDKSICPECEGYRINDQARLAVINGKHIGELAQLPIEQLIEFLGSIQNDRFKTSNGKALIDKIILDLKKFQTIGLGYLHLNRSMISLSGGENQRLSLLNQMNLGLNGVLVILDEPTMGMHEIEKRSLGQILQNIRDAGNSVIIVEHDEDMIRIADEIIDMGPGAGVLGGEVIFQGPFSELSNAQNSITGQYFAQTLQYPKKDKNNRRKVGKSAIQMREISTNNLKHVNVDIPLGMLVGICGMSGSGKSSLISDTLVHIIQKNLKNRLIKLCDSKELNKTEKTQKTIKKSKNLEENSDLHENSSNKEENEEEEDRLDPMEKVEGTVEGWDQIEDCIIVDQSPIGRNRNSFPASYIGLWDYIRKLFAQQPEAKKRKYQDGHFSFNSDKGRCPRCKGEGKISLQISFLDELVITCEECGGMRYRPEILEITYANKNIREILDLSVTESIQIFNKDTKILSYLKILEEMGMGYITLGQPATTLSGGESQRIKLAKALGSVKHSNTLFIMDEPTTGLHFDDEKKLMLLMDRLVDQGNTIIVIEHDVNILSYCDHIIELGPQGGPKGGTIIAIGPPEEIKKNKKSLIGQFLCN
jgi:excinuclease UvrABC ATPase subunit